MRPNTLNARIKLSEFRLKLELPLFLLLTLAIHTTRRSIYDSFRLLRANRTMCRLLTEHCKVAKLIEQLTFKTKDVHRSLNIASSLLKDPLATYLRGYIYTLHTIGSTLDYNEKWILSSIENLETTIREKLNFTATLVEALIIAATLLALGVTLLGIVNSSIMVLLLPTLLFVVLILTHRIRIGLSELQIGIKFRLIATLVESIALLAALYSFLAQPIGMMTVLLALTALIVAVSYMYLYFNKVVELQALGDLVYKFSEQARVLGHIKLVEARDLLIDKRFSKLSKYITYAVKTGKLLRKDDSRVSIMVMFTAYVFANMMRSGTYIARVLDKIADFFRKLYELEHYIIVRFIVYELVMVVGGLINGLAIKALLSLSIAFSSTSIAPQFFASMDIAMIYTILLVALWLGSYAIATMLLDTPISIAAPLTLLAYTILLKIKIVPFIPYLFSSS